MRLHAVQLLQLWKSGTVTSHSIILGIAAFAKAVHPQLTGSGSARTKASISLFDGSNTHYDDIDRAIDAFIYLLINTARKLLPSTLFLSTDFEYETVTEQIDIAMASTIIQGFENLTHIHCKSPTSEPLSRWANMAITANFVRLRSKELEQICYHQLESLARETGRLSIGEGAQILSSSDSTHNSRHIVPGFQDPKSCSLGLLLEQYYGVRSEFVEDSSQPGYRRASKNWNLMLSSFVLDKSDNKIVSALSPSQLMVVRLLIEWWYDKIGFATLTQLAFTALEAASQAGFLGHDALRLLGVDTSAIHDKRRNHYNQRVIFDCTGPPYHIFMFRLFQLEFLPCHYHNLNSQKILLVERQRAAKIAACQRVSRYCCTPSISAQTLDVSAVSSEVDSRTLHSEKSLLDSELEFTSQDAMSLQSPIRPSFNKPRDHDQHNQSAETHFLLRNGDLVPHEHKRIRDLLGSHSNPKLRASISICQWLEPPNIPEDLPHYLWDTEQRKTVLSTKLPDIIEYTAVSHTWGRWKHQDYAKYPKVHLNGLREWGIPQNSKFPVENLPNILASVPFETRYVWFDLVCIPQEPTDERLLHISKQEIGRQAKIFRAAKFAVAWFNDVQSWAGMRAAIYRLSCHFLQEGSFNGVPEAVAEQAASQPDMMLELFNDDCMDSALPEDSMNRWFSSMWTLQEVCLRPDMRLCNHQWDILAVGPNNEIHIGMEDLVALSEGANYPAGAWDSVFGQQPGVTAPRSSQLHRIDPRCKATEQLWELLDLSGLEHLLNATRSTILTLGGQRYCQGNRAEAIMSAVGVTDWYNNTAITLTTSSDYPLSFIREAAMKFGADFYTSNLAQGELLDMLVLSLALDGAARSGVGSMTPFTSSLLSRSPSLAQGFLGIDHPAVQTWSILEDGSVEISEAGILSYTRQTRHRDIPLICTITAPATSEPISLMVEKSEQVDLDVWIDSFLPATPNFAVCLHHGLGYSDGILLKLLRSGELIKVGTYILTSKVASGKSDPMTCAVQWRVI